MTDRRNDPRKGHMSEYDPHQRSAPPSWDGSSPPPPPPGHVDGWAGGESPERPEAPGHVPDPRPDTGSHADGVWADRGVPYPPYPPAPDGYGGYGAHDASGTSGASGYPGQLYGQPPSAPWSPAVERPRGGQGLAVAALVLGILSLVLFLVPVVPVILAIAGVVCAVVHLRRRGSVGRGLAVGGIVTSAIGFGLGILMTIVWGVLGAAVGPVLPELWDCTQLSDQAQVDRCIDGVLAGGEAPGQVDAPGNSGEDQAV